jgi:two-component system, chemotaxis family, chemotaxis protein CheY
MAHILIVDDSSLSRRILRDILLAAEHRVTEAQNGIAALETYFLDKPDLVLLDLTMTGMHGFEVLEQLLRLDPAARVIVASADIQASSRDMAEEAGSVGFVTKPFTAEKVQAAISAALEEADDDPDRETA